MILLLWSFLFLYHHFFRFSHSGGWYTRLLQVTWLTTISFPEDYWAPLSQVEGSTSFILASLNSNSSFLYSSSSSLTSPNISFPIKKTSSSSSPCHTSTLDLAIAYFSITSSPSKSYQTLTHITKEYCCRKALITPSSLSNYSS